MPLVQPLELDSLLKQLFEESMEERASAIPAFVDASFATAPLPTTRTAMIVAHRHRRHGARADGLRLCIARDERRARRALATARRCTCSFCRMRGAVVVSAEMGGVAILAGDDALTSYRFNTRVAEHFFCSRCGIYTHHQRRSNPNEYGVNVACLDGMSPFDFDEVPVMDGVHHPSDTGGQSCRIGTLRFERFDHVDAL